LGPIHQSSDGPDHPIAAYTVGSGVITLWQLPPGQERRPDDNDRNSYVVMVPDTELGEVRQRLAGRGVEVGPLQRSANNEFFWCHDPDDNRFEISRRLTSEFQEAAKTVAAEK
jgi:hypothetical protein